MRSHVSKHTYHVFLALLLAAGCGLAVITVGNTWGMGGVQVSPPFVLCGLLVIEAGRTICCAGAAEKKWWQERLGAGVQGLGVWIGYLSPSFLCSLSLVDFLLHAVLPAVLVIGLSVAMHYAAHFLLRRLGFARPETPGKVNVEV